MKKYAIIFIVIIWLIIFSVAVRHCQMQPNPCGGGQQLESPDSKYLAGASLMHEKYFWGNEREYYEFRVEDKEDFTKVIKKIQMDIPEGQVPFQMRSNAKIIFWAEDSSEVTYIFQDIELKLKINP
ncbi:hypothetical protein KAR91_87860 [Candidatus Pacearchaeota archaeon]|nr:hypothetical protein [Candidatus Pacearchaeota archaeon]